MHERESSRQIVNRMREALGAANDAALAAELGVAPPTVSGWKSEGRSVPLDYCRIVADKSGVSLDWLVLGREPKRLDGLIEDNPAAYQPDPAKRRMEERERMRGVSQQVAAAVDEYSYRLPADLMGGIEDFAYIYKLEGNAIRQLVALFDGLVPTTEE